MKEIYILFLNNQKQAFHTSFSLELSTFYTPNSNERTFYTTATKNFIIMLPRGTCYTSRKELSALFLHSNKGTSYTLYSDKELSTLFQHYNRELSILCLHAGKKVHMMTSLPVIWSPRNIYKT